MVFLQVYAAWLVASKRVSLAGGILPTARQTSGKPRQSSRTTSLYDRRGDEVSMDEIERVTIEL